MVLFDKRLEQAPLALPAEFVDRTKETAGILLRLCLLQMAGQHLKGFIPSRAVFLRAIHEAVQFFRRDPKNAANSVREQVGTVYFQQAEAQPYIRRSVVPCLFRLFLHGIRYFIVVYHQRRPRFHPFVGCIGIVGHFPQQFL